MCGICGLTGAPGVPPDERLVDVMNQAQRHRGPDATYLWRGRRVVLGQTRLAIVDLSEAGGQPFVSPDGSVAVVFNGEIYNHRELRQRFGIELASGCDGAVLPFLWQRLGTAMFAELRGMWAVAIADDTRGELTLARDPFGIKPLHWTRSRDGGIAFASEPRTLLHVLPRPQLSLSALQHFGAYGALHRDQSAFAGISAVAANSWVTFDAAGRETRGWVLPRPFVAEDHGAIPRLRDAFLESVGMHLRSDVPTALLLSSGLDSSALAWACRELGATLDCVTVGFGEQSSEAPEAAATASRYGHRASVATEMLTPELVDQFFRSMQRPSIDGLNTLLVSRAIHDLGIKVALSGLGGDEVLAGYATFRRLRYLRALRTADRARLTPALSRVAGWLATRGALRGKAAELVHSGGPRDAVALGLLSRRVLDDRQLQLIGLMPRARAPGHPLPGSDDSSRALSLTEFRHYLGGTLLPDTDAFSMASSVEMRVPYVDIPFATAGLAVSTSSGVGKRGFATALADPHLMEIARRPKRGFTVPMDEWMRTGPLRASVAAACADDAPVRTLLIGSAVDDLWQSWQERSTSWSRVWLVVALDGWLRSLDTELPVVDDT